MYGSYPSPGGHPQYPQSQAPQPQVPHPPQGQPSQHPQYQQYHQQYYQQPQQHHHAAPQGAYPAQHQGHYQQAPHASNGHYSRGVKRHKSNAVVTRYAPPPSHPSAAPQNPPYQGYPQGYQPAYQHPGQAYPHGYAQNPQPGQASPQGYTAPPSGYPQYPQAPSGHAQYPQYGAHQPPQQAAYQQQYAQYYQQPHGYQQQYQTGHYMHPAQPHPAQPHVDPSRPPPPPPPPPPPIPPQQHHTAPQSTSPTKSHGPDRQPEPYLSQTSSNSQPSWQSEKKSSGKPNRRGDEYSILYYWDDADDTADTDGALWPTTNQEVDQNLSIGIIIWHPAVKVTRPLAPTYSECEQEAYSESFQPLGNGNSVSKYFTLENSYEAFLEVRQTDRWEKIKDDPLFQDYEASDDTCDEAFVIASRARPDVEDEPSEEARDNDRADEEAEWNVMDDLEKALDKGSSPRRGSGADGSPAERRGSSRTRKMAGFDQQMQEDILSQLGVTGPAKPRNFTAPPHRKGSHQSPQSSNHPYQAQQNGFHQQSYQQHLQPPSPPPKSPKYGRRSLSADPWASREANGSTSRRSSFASQHTVAGSDFNVRDSPYDQPMGDSERGRTAARRDISGKRSLSRSSATAGSTNGYGATPTHKRRQLAAADPYGRRW